MAFRTVLATALLSLLAQSFSPGIDDPAQRWVERPMAQIPGVPSAQFDVRMLGQDVRGTHITGHLVTLANPIGRVSLGLPPGGCGTRELTTVTSQVHKPACRLAINAGYFNVDNAACIGNVVSHGAVIQTVPLSQSNVNFGIKDGKFYIGYFSPDEIVGFDHMVSGVTWLVRNGVNYVQRGWDEANRTVQTSGEKYVSNLASRTAVGYDSHGRLVIVQIDGSIAVGHNKRGMDMSMVADLLIKHDVVNAINLDGGGSSAMAMDGVLINYPSDNRPPSCDASKLYQCERQVSTVLCIHEQEGATPVFDKINVAAANQVGENSGNGFMSSTFHMMAGCAVFAVGALSALLARRFLMGRESDEEMG